MNGILLKEALPIFYSDIQEFFQKSSPKEIGEWDLGYSDEELRTVLLDQLPTLKILSYTFPSFPHQDPVASLGFVEGRTLSFVEQTIIGVKSGACFQISESPIIVLDTDNFARFTSAEIWDRPDIFAILSHNDWGIVTV